MIPDLNPISPKVPPRFGLLESSETRWSTLSTKLRELNATAPGNSLYKLIFFGRHGQGKYGTKAWDDYWSKLNGDGELTWGPDPELTNIGKAQAVAANKVWATEMAAGIPLPQKMYCSPMTRALDTHVISFHGVSSTRAVVVENCREEYGEHTCDQRRTRTYITTAFPQFDIERRFTEEDELWTTERETKDHAAARARTVLDRIFRDDKDGIINGFLRVLPVIVKATASLDN
ncbi:histidine phosphatase superfamily [Mycena galericulata]|nr:histidine phosphatase superfamily [Mycena galericulata]